MSEEFDFFSTDFDNLNLNNIINKQGLDSFNNNKKLVPFGYNYVNTIVFFFKRNIEKYSA